MARRSLTALLCWLSACVATIASENAVRLPFDTATSVSPVQLAEGKPKAPPSGPSAVTFSTEESADGAVAAINPLATTTPQKTYAGNYLIVAPKVVRPGLPYSVSISVFRNLNSDHIIRVEIRTDKNETVGARAMSSLRAGAPQIITIENLASDSLVADRDYKLYVKMESSDGKTIFEDEKAVQCSVKSLSIFVQTDKAIYKPSSTVFYRVVVVTPELLPYTDEITLRITDPSQNAVVQILNARLTKGVFAGNLELASEPPLGVWLIQVETRSGVKYDKEFTVEKYVLPKFDVNVRTPTFITLADDLAVLVDAKYTYGKGVVGKAKVAVRHPFSAWIVPEDARNEGHSNGIVERTVDLNSVGEATVVFTNEELRNHKLIMDYGGSSVNIVATVTEQLTDIQRNGTAEIIAYEHDVKLEMEKQGETFKPGLHYNVVVTLKHMDDTPIKATVPRRVQVTIFYNYPFANISVQHEDKDVKIVDLDAHGTAVIPLTPPINCTSARVETYYDREGKDNFTSAKIYNSLYVEASSSPSNSFIQLIADNEGVVDVGKTLSFSVKATESISSITYQVVARGLIIMSQELAISSDSTTITFAANAQMAPHSRLIVYGVRPSNKEVLVDAVDFKVNGLFQNDVSLSVDRNTAEPGDTVKFLVKAAPDSFVGLLAVDQSVLLLKSGNDITREMVEQDIEEYDTTSQSRFGARPWEVRWLRRKRRSLWSPWWSVSGKDASSVFDNAGLIVLTDAFLYKEPEPIIMMPLMAVSNHQFESFAAPKAEAGNVEVVAPRVRRHFPEIWLWLNNMSVSDGEAVYEAKVPDTITSWVASAFAINNEVGLGVAPSVSKLKVFRPFFIRLNLPYSVKRGEKMALQVLVFNYLENEQDVIVTLKHPPNAGFEFVQKSGSVLKKGKDEKDYNVRYVSVPGGGASKAVYFPITLTELGMVKLSVAAQADAVAGDAVEVPLRVEPEGYRVDRNTPFVIDLSTRKLNNASTVSATLFNFKKTFTMDFPAMHVEGSKKARIDVIGDIMGPVLSNVESLVQMPYGCGEQNMVTFVPNIVVLSYLRSTHREKSAIEGKAIRHMESGYQRQLSYRRSDNSFSAFGESDRHGSTWLTAFVIRSFKQAQPYIFIDEQVIEKSIAFLNLQQQMESGAFAERGEIHHKQMQGGAAEGGVALTAYVMIALLENNVKNAKGIAYLENKLAEVKENAYALSVIAYALQLAGSAKSDKAIAHLDALKISSNDGSVHWSAKTKEFKAAEKDSSHYFYQATPMNVEITSYALLTYMLRKETERAIPLVRWLTSQRNAYGGFSSTQDTVLALQALSAYAASVYSPNFNLTINVRNGATGQHVFTINPQNSIVLQSYELPNTDEPIEIEAIGSSVAFVQLYYSYYRQTLRDELPFFCTKDVHEVRGGNRLQLDLCCNYTRTGSRSNMAVAEVNSLSGYKFDNDEMEKLTGIPDLQRVELDKDDTKMNIYFSSLGEAPVCLSLYSDLLYTMADQKPAQLTVYDYYDPEQQIKATYSNRQTRSLDETCMDCWPADTLPSGFGGMRADSASAAAAGHRAGSIAPSSATSTFLPASRSQLAVYVLPPFITLLSSLALRCVGGAAFRCLFTF